MSYPEVKLNELYQEVILDHNRHPRNFKKLEHATAQAHGVNSLCGDDYMLFLRRDNGSIREVGFQGQGCAISKASASLLTVLVEGKSPAEAAELKDNFLRLLTQETVPAEVREKVGKLKMFEGVKNYPIRVKCATLIWRTLEEALKDERDRRAEVSTETVKS